MYIEPNTTIRLIRNCPLDTTQEHTLWFDSVDEQTAYFLSLDGVNFLKQTYQRHGRGVLRVQSIADNLYDCNYLMFKNDGFKTTSGGSKWFYGFIKSVNYVNNNTSEIEYIIDEMQTWLFDYQLGECFIEREHSATDEIGENLVPESLEIGDYISVGDDEFYSGDYITELNDYSIVVACTSDITDGAITNSKGGVYGRIFSGVTYHAFPNTVNGITDYQNFMDMLTDEAKTEGITSVFLMPTKLITNKDDWTLYRYEYTIPKVYGISRSDFTPVKNNKLFTYPYTFLYVSNMQGLSTAFKYEYFDEDSLGCRFSYFGDYSPTPSVILYPKNYKGVANNYDEKMVLTGYPQLSYNIDTYKAWVAQHGSSYMLNTFTGVATGVSTMILGASLGSGTAVSSGIASTVNTVLSSIANIYEKSIMPNQSKGGGSPIAMASHNKLNFLFLHKHIRSEFVTIIDDFFNMFGYATHKVKIPNRNVRPHWTYVKTNGCVVHGSVPADAMRNICKIYDRGVTFWKNGAEVGQYHLDNSPV